MIRPRVTVLGAVLGLLALVLVAGCVSVPTTGPVSPVTAQQPAPDAKNVQVPESPTTNADRADIVSGFLTAYALGGSDEQVAREYLVPAQAAVWDPDGTVLVYSTDENTPSVKDDGSSFAFNIVGQVNRFGVYSTANVGSSFWEPQLVQSGGQWRIQNPPPAILVSVSLFRSLYNRYFLYYFDATFSVLVPYPIYLRYAPEDRLTPVALLAKLRAPEDPIFGTARNAFDVDLTPKVTVNNAIANVDFSDQSLPTGDEPRRQFVAQILYTLSQLPQVKGVQLNGGVYKVPGPTPGSETVDTVMAGAYASYAPSTTRDDPTLYGLTQRDGIVALADPAGSTDARPVPGAPDVAAGASFAVSGSADEIAVVDRDRRRLTVTGLPDRKTRLTYRGRDLLPPQFTRFGEVWTVKSVDGATGTVSTLVALDQDGNEHLVSSDLGSGRVIAFRISPDGTRIAVARKTGTTYAISVSPIDRGSSPAIELGLQVPFRPDAATLPTALTVDDVAWEDPTKLFVLADNELYSIELDGSEGEVVGRAALWEVDRIAATAPPADGQPAPVLFGVKKRSWLFENNGWQEIRRRLTYLAYPG